MSDIVERLRNADTTRRIGESYADTHERRQRDRDEAADRIEQLEAALREIAKHSRGGVIDTTEKMDRDEFIGIARAALEEK